MFFLCFSSFYDSSITIMPRPDRNERETNLINKDPRIPNKTLANTIHHFKIISANQMSSILKNCMGNGFYIIRVQWYLVP